MTEDARTYILQEGTDVRYGARHLKRALDRRVVRPISNLIATRQVHGGDLIRVDFDEGRQMLSFHRDATGVMVPGVPQPAVETAVEGATAAAAAVAPVPQPIQYRRGKR